MGARDVPRGIDLLAPETVYQIGIDPIRIAILTTVEPLEFAQAWTNRAQVEVDDRTWPFLGRDDLIRSKRAAARPHDLKDIEALEQF